MQVTPSVTGTLLQLEQSGPKEVRYEVFMAVMIQVTVFSVVTPCNDVVGRISLFQRTMLP
jgi:hypothetical protein